MYKDLPKTQVLLDFEMFLMTKIFLGYMAELAQLFKKN